MTLRANLDLAVLKMAETETLLRAAQVSQTQALNALQRAVKRAEKTGLDRLSPAEFPATEHRRAHRPGRPPKIETDPEIQAFIAARIDRMTFVQIATAIAEHFPPARQVRKSAIHAWWQRNKKNPPRPET